jgi:hypothetical protein
MILSVHLLEMFDFSKYVCDKTSPESFVGIQFDLLVLHVFFLAGF